MVDDYGSYVSSFIRIKDERVEEEVRNSLGEGLLWPDPLIQLNPSFEAGETVDELVAEGVLHEGCARVFRKGKKPKEPHNPGEDLRLHRHQAEAIRTARGGHNYVLTTGTGSGKSLAYIVPVVDHVLRRGPGRGIQAIVVYPMNALANSQYGELEKFLKHGYPDERGPVTFARYTGQESDEERQRIIADPPDILLTNYVMLELILTRSAEQGLVRAAQDLGFLVFDELHTYRGRQGADVAFLIRRVRELLAADNLRCVGTSATIAGSGTHEEQRAEISGVATRLFGADVHPENVIGETLRRATPEQDPEDTGFVEELTARIRDEGRTPPTQYEAFVRDPLSIWIESTFGVVGEPGTGRLVRAQPVSISGPQGAARRLSGLTGLPEGRCASAIQEGLLAGYECEPPEESTGRPPFAFRLHQFVSRGDAVYASIEEERERYITLKGQQFVPGDRDRVLMPLAFCRECGQEYYPVRSYQDPASFGRVFRPRAISDTFDDGESEAGFLFFSTREPWPSEAADTGEFWDRLPTDWQEQHRGAQRVRKDRRRHVPQPTKVAPDGTENTVGLEGHYFPAPFRFCLSCGISYAMTLRSDFTKLGSLGSEGRSSATTILSLSAISGLREAGDLRREARKVLSFTDNRQDASLQAGHFNDFVEIGLLRSALHQAVAAAGEDGLSHDELTQAVFDALGLPFEQYASNPLARFKPKTDTEGALRDVLGYRVYRDLERGWRLTSPNLEQCGLLKISYESLEDVCEAEDVWEGKHPALLTATPATRAKVAQVLLDDIRRRFAIKVDYLDSAYQERIVRRSNQHLIPPWAIDQNEADKLQYAAILFPRPQKRDDVRTNAFLSARGGFGQYLRRPTTFEDYPDKPNLEETGKIIRDLLDGLTEAGIVEMVAEPKNGPDGEEEVPGYQVQASAMRWIAGDGTEPFHDPIRTPDRSEAGGTNRFFVDFYKEDAAKLRGLEAREHTAQVPYEVREEREERFREARLPILYCLPTMELGVDIAELNAVNLRNMPPTPANYAQRSGREQGQPLAVGQVREDAVVGHIEGDVVDGLGDRDDVPAEGVGDPGLVHHVRVLAGKVDHDDSRLKNEVEDVLDDRAVFPDAVRAQAAVARLLAGPLNGLVDGVESRAEGHHRRHEVGCYAAVGNPKDARREGNLALRRSLGDVVRVPGKVFVEVFLDDVEGTGVVLGDLPQDGEHVGGVVAVVPRQAAKQPRMVFDGLPKTGEQADLFPVADVEVGDDSFSEGDEALAQRQIHRRAPSLRETAGKTRASSVSARSGLGPTSRRALNLVLLARPLGSEPITARSRWQIPTHREGRGQPRRGAGRPLRP